LPAAPHRRINFSLTPPGIKRFDAPGKHSMNYPG